MKPSEKQERTNRHPSTVGLLARMLLAGAVYLVAVALGLI
jgi:hypothetical protein